MGKKLNGIFLKSYYLIKNKKPAFVYIEPWVSIFLNKQKMQLSYCLVFCRLFHGNFRLFDIFNVTRTNDSLIVIF